jgi:hypothetical protein
MHLPLLTDGTRSLETGGTPEEPGMIEGFLVVDCAFESSLVTLEEIDGAGVFVWGAGAGFAPETFGFDPVIPRFQTFETRFFAEERKAKRDVCLGVSVSQNQQS